MKKAKDIRKFLNPLNLDEPGALSTSWFYNKDSGQLDSVTLRIGDCSRTLVLEFDGDCVWSDYASKLKQLKNSIAKAKLIRDTADEILQELLKVKLTKTKSKPKKKVMPQ